MPTICPNCLHSVRTDAKFCGFCGTNLKPTTHDEATGVIIPAQKSEDIKENQITLKQPRSGRNKTKRVVLIILIILLCFVLLVAFLLHYWSILGTYINNFLSLFIR